MNRKIYFNEIKKEICLHQLFSKLHNYFSTKSPCTSIHFHQRCTSFFKSIHFVFCHSNLLAPILHFWTALPSVSLYSHQHPDHHKWLTFIYEFQLEELFPRLRIQQLNRTSQNSSISMCTGEDCKHLCVQSEVWWKRDTMRLHRTSFIQICLM